MNVAVIAIVAMLVVTLFVIAYAVSITNSVFKLLNNDSSETPAISNRRKVTKNEP